MRRHITSVLEFQTIGLLLRGPGRHAVRVMGALRVVRPPDLPHSKEELAALVDRAPFAAYYAEGAPGAPDDRPPDPEGPQVPAPFVTREGEVVFLERDADATV